MSTPTTDLGPAVRRMQSLVDGIDERRLDAPTPCERYTVGDLVDHVIGLAAAFTAAAEKDLGEVTSQPPAPSAAHLPADWREQAHARLDRLAAAWLDPAAWEGMTMAGGVELPGEVAGAVALNELVVHGWDLARASGRPYEVDAASLEVSLGFAKAMSVPGQEAGREGLFGPMVDVPAEAPALDRLIGMTGRDPGWSPT